MRGAGCYGAPLVVVGGVVLATDAHPSRFDNDERVAKRLTRQHGEFPYDQSIAQCWRHGIRHFNHHDPSMRRMVHTHVPNVFVASDDRPILSLRIGILRRILGTTHPQITHYSAK